MRIRNFAVLVLGVALFVGSAVLYHFRFRFHLATPLPSDSYSWAEIEAPESTAVIVLDAAGIAGFTMILTGFALLAGDGIKHLREKTR